MARKREPHHGTEFNVRYPPWARSLSAGRARVYRTFLDPKVGQAWVAQEEAKKKALRAGGEKEAIGVRVTPDLTFTAASGLWLKAFTGADDTRYWYTVLLRAHILPCVGDIRCSQLGRDEVQAYLQGRAKAKASLDARAKELGIVRSVLRWARDGGHPVDPTAWKVKKPKVIRTTRQYNPGVMKRLLAACETERDRTILTVALFTGFRQGELRSFDAGWISWREHVIHVPITDSFAPKSRRARTIPMSRRLEEILKTWLHGRTTGLVFPPMRFGVSGSGENQGAYLRGIIQRAKKTAKVKIRGMHDLRHCFACWLYYDVGYSLVEVQQVLGHADISTTRKYLHLPTDFVESARERLDRAEVAWAPEESGGIMVGRKVLEMRKRASR